MLEYGADLGIEGEWRWSLEGPNNESVYDYGSRVADSLQTALQDGIMYGPLRREEMPWEQFKCSPMTVRLKPNGRARTIMDNSYPHNETPNMGMKNYEEFEPVKMVGDVQWRRCMSRAGRPAEKIKADWYMAYTHVSVRWEDHRLQVVEFCGRYFIK